MYIEGNVNESRDLVFSDCRVIEGEKNCHFLRINTAFAPEADFFILNFEVSPFGKTFSTGPITENSSPAFIDGGCIVCPLTERLTSGLWLKIQAQAHSFDGENETIIKTGIAKIEIDRSIYPGCPLPEGDLSLAAQVNRLAERIDRIENIKEFDFDYFAAGTAASLLWVSDTETPVYYPSDSSEAQYIITRETENFDYESCRFAAVVCPSSQGERASLVIISDTGEGISIGRYTGAEILGYILSETEAAAGE